MDKIYVFWLEYRLMHMADLITKLASSYRVLVFVERDIPDYRRDMGFKQPCFGNAVLLATPHHQSPAGVSYLKDFTGDDADRVVHIFHGLDYCKKNYVWLKILSEYRANFFIQMETMRLQGLKMPLRYIKMRYIALRWRKRVAGILAFGAQGKEFYQKAGFFKEQVHEWRYFGPEQPIKKHESNKSSYDVVFVGSLNERKNVTLLVKAVAVLRKRTGVKLNVKIVGDGPQMELLKALSVSYGIADHINFLSCVQNDEVFDIFLDSKILVLPSLHDGWGYVVNEALSAGCNIVVSTRCGCSSIFKGIDCNKHVLFDPFDEEDLATALEESLKAWTATARVENIKLFEKKLSSQKGVEMLKLLN